MQHTLRTLSTSVVAKMMMAMCCDKHPKLTIIVNQLLISESQYGMFLPVLVLKMYLTTVGIELQSDILFSLPGVSIDSEEQFNLNM